MKGNGFLVLALLAVLIFPSFSQEETNIVTVLRRMFPEATIEFDSIRNTLIITATPDEQVKIEEMIQELDIYTPQITIEAKFIELTVNDINELGIDLDMPERTFRNLKDITAEFTTPWEDAGQVILTRLGEPQFRAILQALERRKKVNVLSAPRITTLNRQPATIQFTETIPYVTDVTTKTEEGRLMVEYDIEEKDAGIYLEVTPNVPEGSTLITLHIRSTVRHLVEQIAGITHTPAELGWPIIDERTCDTSMVISSGETIALGGLIRQEEMVVEKKLPILGDIPLVGHLFRHKSSTDEKNNLIIFLTAYLVSPRGERIVARR